MKRYGKMTDDNDVLKTRINRNINREQCGGYPCPVCGEIMHISLYKILESEYITCPACKYKMMFHNDRKQRKFG